MVVVRVDTMPMTPLKKVAMVATRAAIQKPPFYRLIWNTLKNREITKTQRTMQKQYQPTPSERKSDRADSMVTSMEETSLRPPKEHTS